MVTAMLLTAILTAQNPLTAHVRSNEPKIAALIDAGIAQSATFRRLVEMSNESDITVYIDLKRSHLALDAFLSHAVLATGGYRYVRIAFNPAGNPRRALSILAHELQHAVEVAAAPDARDEKSTEAMFNRIAVAFGCGHTNCSETRAARNVEDEVGAQLARSASRCRQREACAQAAFRAIADIDAAAMQ